MGGMTEAKVTCVSCYNFCGRHSSKDVSEIRCRVLGWVQIRNLRDCREDSAAREPGVNEADWDDE